MLEVGDDAPDFRVGERTLHQMLEERKVVVFFFPKTFTKG
jgi:peroxiredoxin